MFTANASLDSMLNGGFTGMAGRELGFESHAMQQAIGLFREARFQARIGRLVAAFSGRRRSLRSLAETGVDGAIQDRHYAGVRTIPVSGICGSENRCHDFDSDFLPAQEHSRERWLSVARARLGGVALPAVEVVQVEGEYYVRDGHHRISVAKALGERFIEAEVTVWLTGEVLH